MKIRLVFFIGLLLATACCTSCANKQTRQLKQFNTLLSRHAHSTEKLKSGVVAMFTVGEPAEQYQLILNTATDKMVADGEAVYVFVPGDKGKKSEGDPYVVIVVDTKTQTIKSATVPELCD